jgi:resuscitation-promoting factor RpfA
MSGRHRKPTNTTLCLARVGTLTVMATLPLAVAGTAMATTPTLTDRGSAKWADDDSKWSDDDSATDSDSSRDNSDDWDSDDDSDGWSDSDDADDSDDSARSRNDDSDSSADDDTPSRRGHRAARAATHDHSPSWRHTDSPSWKEPKAHTWQKPAKPSWKKSGASWNRSEPSSANAQEARWDKLAQCESTQNWDANTGNGYKGGLQFNDATWRAYGGRQYAPTADQASREQQIAVAKKVQSEQGWHAWPGCSNKLGYT